MFPLRSTDWLFNGLSHRFSNLDSFQNDNFSGLQQHSALSYSVDTSVGQTSRHVCGHKWRQQFALETGAVEYSDMDSTFGLAFVSLDSQLETLFVAPDSVERTSAVS